MTTLDLESRRFAHLSQTDDGNPSYAEWAWDVVETPGGGEVTVSWKLNRLQSAVDRSVASG